MGRDGFPTSPSTRAMTLLPCAKSEISTRIPQVVAAPPEVVCAHPDCECRWALETHHVVRRTETGGPKRWVVVNGVVLLNERKLCREHHAEVTGGLGGHRGWIRYLEGQAWVWYAPCPAGVGGVQDKLGGWWCPVGPLKVVT